MRQRTVRDMPLFSVMPAERAGDPAFFLSASKLPVNLTSRSSYGQHVDLKSPSDTFLAG